MLRRPGNNSSDTLCLLNFSISSVIFSRRYIYIYIYINRSTSLHREALCITIYICIPIRVYTSIYLYACFSLVFCSSSFSPHLVSSSPSLPSFLFLFPLLLFPLLLLLLACYPFFCCCCCLFIFFSFFVIFSRQWAERQAQLRVRCCRFNVEGWLNCPQQEELQLSICVASKKKDRENSTVKERSGKSKQRRQTEKENKKTAYLLSVCTPEKESFSASSSLPPSFLLSLSGIFFLLSTENNRLPPYTLSLYENMYLSICMSWRSLSLSLRDWLIFLGADCLGKRERMNRLPSNSFLSGWVCCWERRSLSSSSSTW